MCAAAVPAASTTKVACATRATESSARTFSITSLAMRATTMSAMSLVAASTIDS